MEVTVVVTVYNIEKYLDRFFDSFLSQSYADFSLLMIDDGSTDDSVNICKRRALSDERIKVISLPHVGIAKARNIAMEHLSSPFTVYADGDDYVEKDYLKNLVEAQKKYDADLVISRVRYLLEDGTENGVFPPRGEKVFTKKDFMECFPQLLEDRRLNYLYAKIYRTELLKGIRVEDDVRQGSDTMINCMYLAVANKIVSIDNVDYNYIKYNSRSVTSYSGEDAFSRLLRINQFIKDETSRQGLFGDELRFVVNKRILQSAIWVADKIIETPVSPKTKKALVQKISSLNRYVEAYAETAGKGGLQFSPIKPYCGKKYVRRRLKAIKRAKRKAAILKRCPKFIVKIFHKIKGVKDD